MAKVTIILEDTNDGDMNVKHFFDPPPVSVDQENSDYQTLAQEHGLFLLETLIERPLTDDDITPAQENPMH